LKKQNLPLTAAIAHSTTSVSMPANHCPSGARTDGYTSTIRAAGFNGIADIIWAAECRKKTFDRLGVGRQRDDTSGRSNFTASPVTRPAANANDRLFFTGPTIVENSDPRRAAMPDVVALCSRGEGLACSQHNARVAAAFPWVLRMNRCQRLRPVTKPLRGGVVLGAAAVASRDYDRLTVP
jgi:hypothetical protein